MGGTGYFRLSAVRSYLDSGVLRRVASAPEFSYSVHMVYSSHLETDLVDTLRRGFSASVRDLVDPPRRAAGSRRRRPPR